MIAAILAAVFAFLAGVYLGRKAHPESEEYGVQEPEEDVQPVDPYLAGEYGRLLAWRDRLISEGVDPDDLELLDPPA